jgi:hypothetical protein
MVSTSPITARPYRSRPVHHRKSARRRQDGRHVGIRERHGPGSSVEARHAGHGAAYGARHEGRRGQLGAGSAWSGCRSGRHARESGTISGRVGRQRGCPVGYVRMTEENVAGTPRDGRDGRQIGRIPLRDERPEALHAYSIPNGRCRARDPSSENAWPAGHFGACVLPRVM